MYSQKLAWLLLAPTLVILFLFGVLPFLYVLYVSFHDWNPFAANPEMVFSGANNFRRVVFDQGFLASLGVTVAFVFFAVLSELVIGYALAQAFMKEFPGKAFFRTIHTLPLIMAPIIVGSVWKLMTTPSIGIIPSLLDSWFGVNLNIGQSAWAAFVITVIMDVWHWTPLVTLTLIAALVSLPADPFEQAQIDGANKRQIFWHITLPMIAPAVVATVFIRLMDALRTVDEVLMLTGGGPGSATRYVGVHIFKEVFPRTNYGYGSAVSVIVLYLTIVACWLLYVSMLAPRKSRKG
ncbi:sugar ABC transporter permease [Cereibacter azotoformans]|uniref:Carbohydrate ABC transporter membrane protein 1 (CUT1 family) n=1 Tax=Cereibacter azotoformans TaxID=43057 RepID=A0A2T5K5M7_9RHOB|nr:sugar ABC transporter permease [Cereibacter azotoformans]AXQ95550.1 sugar ABC transporter permease [Cereibacter sphaeroides]PTR17735.1 carbohydrate ABC transporter membrane protein 1 (CUT1 family) [Cereibacter azotoformans]UIJ32205.1 sugar ABC transporter permease [Cereibacter azotoformans]ULB11904.1 sugar ABC transporter permease [Cereibacter azotoformans]